MMRRSAVIGHGTIFSLMEEKKTENGGNQ